MPLAFYEIQTTLRPGVTIQVDEDEYLRLLEQGLIEGVPVGPILPAVFDEEIAERFVDPLSATRAAADAVYVTGDGVRKAVKLTQATYSALAVKDPATLYVIV